MTEKKFLAKLLHAEADRIHDLYKKAEELENPPNHRPSIVAMLADMENNLHYIVHLLELPDES